MLPPFMLYIITRGISYYQVLFFFSASSKPPGPFIAQKARTEGDQFRLVKSLFHFSREIKLKFNSPKWLSQKMMRMSPITAAIIPPTLYTPMASSEGSTFLYLQPQFRNQIFSDHTASTIPIISKIKPMPTFS